MTFSGNTAPVRSSYAYASGGAIYTEGNLSIQNNESVEFYQNAEVKSGVYRLRSIYAGGSGDEISLSAAAGKSITFRDSIYIDSGSTFKLNEAYEGMPQQGDIIFTGATTVDDLYAVKGNVAGTAEEIHNSRTSEVYTMTNLYGGRLRVEEGAVYKGNGITAMEGSAATVRVQNATLSHEGYDLTFNAGTTLELAGNNTISGNVQMLEGSMLRFISSAGGELTTHTGSLNVAGALVVELQRGQKFGQGEIHLGLFQTNDSDRTWNPTSVRVITSADYGEGVVFAMGDVEWVDNVFGIRCYVSDTVHWNNAAGDGLWNNSSANWVSGGYSFAGIQGTYVILGATGQGEITLVGDIAQRSLTVENECSYELDFATDASLTVRENLVLGSGSVLTVHGDMAAAGVNAQGTLVVDGCLNVAGGVTAGSLQVANLTAGSLQAASLTARTLTLTDTAAVSTIGSSVSLSGAVAVAGRLDVTGSLSAGSLAGNGNTLSAASNVVIVSDIAGDENMLIAGAALTTGDIDGDSNELDAGMSITTGAIAGSINVLSAGDSIEAGAVTGVANKLTAIEGTITTGAISGGANTLTANGNVTVDGSVASDNTITSAEGIITVDGDITGTGNELKATEGTITVTGDITDGDNTLTADNVVVVGALEGDNNKVAASVISLGAVAGNEVEIISSGVSNTADNAIEIGELSATDSIVKVEDAAGSVGSIRIDSITAVDSSAIGTTGNSITTPQGNVTIGTLTDANAKTTIEVGSQYSITVAGEAGQTAANTASNQNWKAGKLAIEAECGLSLTDSKLAITGGVEGTSLTLTSSTLDASDVDLDALSIAGNAQVTADTVEVDDLTIAGTKATLNTTNLTVTGELTLQDGAKLSGENVSADTLVSENSDLKISELDVEGLVLKGSTAQVTNGLTGLTGEVRAEALNGEASSLTTSAISTSSQVVADASTITTTQGGISAANGVVATNGGSISSIQNITSANAGVTAENGGSISAEGNITADTTVKADGGSISAKGDITAGSMEITNGGSITADDVTLRGVLNASGGKLTADSVSGATSATLSNASIAGELAMTGTDADVTADGGSIGIITGANDVTLENQAEVKGSITMSGALEMTNASAASVSGATGATLSNATIAGELAAGATEVLKDSMVGSATVGALKVATGASLTADGDVAVTGAVDAAGSLTVEGTLTAASLQASSLEAAGLTLTDSSTASHVTGAVQVSGQVQTAADLTVGGAMSAQQVRVDGALTAASLQASSLEADGLTLTDSSTASHVTGAVQVSGQVQTAADLTVGGAMSAQQVSVGGALTAASLQAASLEADGLTLTDSSTASQVTGSVKVRGQVQAAAALSVGGAMSAQQVSVAGALSAASLQTDALESSSLKLTDATASNRIGSSVAMTGAVDVAGSLTVDGALTAASLQTGTLEASSLKLTDAYAQNHISGAATLAGAVDVAGALMVDGVLTAASLQAGALEAGALVLTVENAANAVSGNLTAGSVSLVAGSSLTVGGVLTANEVQMTGTALTLTAGSFGASTMNFELDRAALESLGLGYKQTETIAQVSSALASGFVATLNGGADEVLAGAYKYTLSASGSSVQVTADYAHDGMQVWYRGAWVGNSEWDEFYIAGYDVVDGVEQVSLNGKPLEGSVLVVALEDSSARSVITNGNLEFVRVILGGGVLELGAEVNLTAAELSNRGSQTLMMNDGSTLDVGKITLGTLRMETAKATIGGTSTINAIEGAEGSICIKEGGKLTVKSDVTLTGLDNNGTLSMAKKKLTVNALVLNGGNVTAGEVYVQNRHVDKASFKKLVADKVTVKNNVESTWFTDDLSVGDGSAIGELVAETLEVRGGTVTLGRTSGSTAMSLLALDLQEDATLVLNQQTTLEVTDALTATENATVQLKKDASVSYDGVNIANRKESGTLDVNAYALSGETELELNGAHVAATGSEDKIIDYKLVNSTVENAGAGTLRVTHAGNSLSGVVAGSGNVEVYNVTGTMSLDELRIATGLSVSLLTGDAGTAIEPENEANVTVVGLAVFEKGATLNANLTMAAGSELRMEGPLHMGSTLELVSGADSITLSGSMYDAVAGMQLGESMTLFTGVDALVLTFDGVSVSYQPGDIQVGDRVLASDYFGNMPEQGANQHYYITFTNTAVGGGELAFFLAPEPTTTTLSLLALTALAARRRRK